MALAVPVKLIVLATLRCTEDVAAPVGPVKLSSLAMFEATEGISGVGDTEIVDVRGVGDAAELAEVTGVGDAAELANVTGVRGGGVPDVTGGAKTRTVGGIDGGDDVVE